MPESNWLPNRPPNRLPNQLARASARMHVMVDPALREGAEIAGDRWVLLTLWALEIGPRRFGDLVVELDGIAPNVLIDRLRRMERDGLVVAALYSQRPRRYVYDLSATGRSLAAALSGLADWAAQRAGAPRREHDVCGTPIESRSWCPACSVPIDAEATDDAGREGLRWL